MASEKQWVQSLKPRLVESLDALSHDNTKVCVEVGKRLAYANEILSYKDDDIFDSLQMAYETDILVYDSWSHGKIIPRVVIEAKVDSVTTHDALTYSSKAATHKQVHPYLRYGIIIGALGSSLPPRLVRHGAYFDFMMAFNKYELTDDEWASLINIIKEEIAASRSLQQFLSDRTRRRNKYAVLHRPLRLTD